MNRKQWLTGTASLQYLQAQLVKQDCKSIQHDKKTAERAIAVISDMADEWKRSVLLCYPHSPDKFVSQLKRQGIQYAKSEHVFGMFQVDFRNVSAGTWNVFRNMIKSFYCSESAKTDSEISWGATARLTPTTQKMKRR